MALLLVACGPADKPAGELDLSGQDCLLIVLDATHAAHLSCYGAEQPVSPVIDGLAKNGVRFARAWSNSSWTLPSTTSLFTGLYEQTHGVRSPEHALDPRAGTMAESFAGAGYATASFIQNPYAGRSHGLDRGFELHEIELPYKDDELADQAAAFLNDREDGRPRFAYVHFRRPHAPYNPSDEARALFVTEPYDGQVTGALADIDGHNKRGNRLVGNDLSHLRSLYRANIHDVDRTLGRLFTSVDLDRTLVVVVSDHGEAFAQHRQLGHNWRSYEEFVHVPLVAAHPSLARDHVVTEAVQTLDLLPTFLELFDLPAPAQRLAGRSQVDALNGGRGADRRGVFTSSRPNKKGKFWLAASNGRFKLMIESPEGREFLFDLEKDPGESKNLIRSRVKTAGRLRKSLDRWLERARAKALTVGESERVDEETLEHLRELGYVR